ncbi:MAG: hypothetical protein KC776_14930 [Myxococcales bacterium]|nr:hypothetical protein [Myxococcales bacterium]MCB9579809.1 hypothetical protein [Polyangiaceae bacterium]
MQIKVERFLAITALLASTAAVAAGCSSEDVATDTDAGVSGSGGVGGTGGGTAGSGGGQAGSAGQAGSGGTAGVAGAAGGGGTAGADGGACLGDDTQSDAGLEGGICAGLPYYSTSCPGDPDAGIEGGLQPSGAIFCDYMELHGRPGVTEALYNCLAAINVSDQCSVDHDNAVNDCINNTFSLACGVGPVTVGDAGATSCKDVADSCPAVSGGTAGIDESQCQQVMNSMNEQTRVDIIQCYNDYAPGTNDCAEDFKACAYGIDAYNTP